MNRFFKSCLVLVLILLLTGCSLVPHVPSQPEDLPVSKPEEASCQPKLSILNFAVLDDSKILVLLKDLLAGSYSLGWINLQKDQNSYSLEDVTKIFPLPSTETPSQFKLYKKGEGLFLFTQAGYYQINEDSCDTVTSFPYEQFAWVQYNPSLDSFLYIDLKDRNLYLEKASGERSLICEAKKIAASSSNESVPNPYLPSLASYPNLGKLSDDLLFYWQIGSQTVLHICDLDGNILSSINRADHPEYDPDFLGIDFFSQPGGQYAFVLRWLSVQEGEDGNHLFTTHFDFYDANFQMVRQLDPLCGIDPASPVFYDPAQNVVYANGSVSREKATVLRNQIWKINLGDGSYEVLAEDSFIYQMQFVEGYIFWLNEKSEIYRISERSGGK